MGWCDMADTKFGELRNLERTCKIAFEQYQNVISGSHMTVYCIFVLILLLDYR